MRAIDADATIKEIKARNPDDVSYEDAWAITCIEHAPTIEPQRKKGKWVNANDEKWNTVEVLKCSVCGEVDNRMYRTDNFCPNCWAEME